MIPWIAVFLAKRFALPAEKALGYARLVFVGALAVGLLMLIVIVDRGCDAYSRRQAEKERLRLERAVDDAKKEEIQRQIAVNDAANRVNVAADRVNRAKTANVEQQRRDAEEALRRFECEVEGKCR